MQELRVKYLKPDSGISAEQFAGEIIEMLDGPKQREVMGRSDRGESDRK